MTKVLLGVLVAAMLGLTGFVAYSHFAAPAVAEASADGTQPSGCTKCGSCCAHELPKACCEESTGCTECEKAKKAVADEPKTEVKDEPKSDGQ